MRRARWVAGALVIALASIAGIGYLLPVAHEASSSADIAAPADTVYAVVADVARYAEWWPEVERVEMLSPVDGRVRFREHMRDGPIVMEVVEAVAPARLVTRIADPDQPFGGSWTIAVAPTPTGARVTVTERGEVYNPIFRFLSRFVFGHTATMERFLAALQARGIARPPQ